MDLSYILTHLPSKYNGCAIDKVDYGVGVEQGETFERKNKNDWGNYATGRIFTAKELARELERLQSNYEEEHDEGCIRFYINWSPYDYEEVESEIINEMKGHRTRAPAKKRSPAVRVDVRKMF